MNKAHSFTFQDITGFKFGTSLFGEPRMFVHTYHVDGLLIDTGHVNMRSEICTALSSLHVDQMVVTHHHEDHSGNIAALRALYSCPVYASAECAALMKSPPKISPAQWATWGKYDAFHDFEIIGDRIKTPKYTFDIVPIPGHAIDMIALHEPSQGWLFSADLYVYHRIKYFMRAERMKDQMASIKKVLQLDFDQMFCSHNPIIDGDPKTLLKKKLTFFEEFYGSVVQLKERGLDEKAIFKALKLKEEWYIKLFSLGGLSTMNMVRSVLRDEMES